MPPPTMRNPVTLTSLVKISEDQVSADLPGKGGGVVIILGLTDGLYFELDEVGARVWSLLQQSSPLQSVLDVLLEEYDVGRTQCEQDLLQLVDELIDRDLVQVIDRASP